MEKKSLKKLLALSLAAMLCTSVSSVTVNNAFATDGDAGAGDVGSGEPVATTNSGFVVEEKAAIRVGDPAGMRFYANISEEKLAEVRAADEFGFLIFPHEYLTYEDAGVGADWHVKYTDDSTPYGLYDYVEVSTTDVADVIYQREDGVWCVNGVLHTVVDETMEFSAIAYYVQDGEYVYADFNEDFSRSLSFVAKWAYLNEPTKRDMIETTFDWFDATEFTIDSGADLQRLSNVVRADNTLAGINFTLSKTIAVDGSTFTPVPADFAGTWNWNGRAILVIADEDDTTDDERAFVSDTYNKTAKRHYTYYQYKNGVAVMSSKLVDVTNTMLTSDGLTAFTTGTIHAEGMAVSDKVTDVANQNYYVDYTGAAVSFTLGGEPKASNGNYYLSVTTNDWVVPINSDGDYNDDLYSELEAMKELYTQIKFRIYIEYDDSQYHALYDTRMSVSDSYKGLLSDMGYKATTSPLPEGYWMELSFTIDEFLTVCASRDKNVGLNGTSTSVEEASGNVQVGGMMLPLGRFGVLSNKAQDVYFGDCVFVK